MNELKSEEYYLNKCNSGIDIDLIEIYTILDQFPNLDEAEIIPINIAKLDWYENLVEKINQAPYSVNNYSDEMLNFLEIERIKPPSIDSKLTSYRSKLLLMQKTNMLTSLLETTNQNRTTAAKIIFQLIGEGSVKGIASDIGVLSRISTKTTEEEVNGFINDIKLKLP